MPSYAPAKYGTEYVFYVGLSSVATAGAFQANPTLASGDVKISKNGGALANLTTLPAVTPASSKLVKVTISATEMQADNVTVIFSDASGAEWYDLIVNIQTAARQIDDLAYPTVSGRSIDVTTTGEVGIDLANVGSPTTALNLSGTTIKTATDVETDTADIQSRLPAALVSGRIDSSVGAIANDAITAASIANDAIGADALAADAVAEIVAAMTAPDNAGIAGIKTKTDNLPVDTADVLAEIAGYLDTEIAAIKAKTDNLPAAPAATGDIPSTANIWAHVVEGTLTAEQLLRIMLAAMGGKSTGGGTTTPAFRDVADAKDRIAATVDNDGNRTAIVLDGT